MGWQPNDVGKLQLATELFTTHCKPAVDMLASQLSSGKTFLAGDSPGAADVFVFGLLNVVLIGMDKLKPELGLKQLAMMPGMLGPLAGYIKSCEGHEKVAPLLESMESKVPQLQDGTKKMSLSEALKE